MRVEQRVEGEEERLSTEELHALRARLFGETSNDPKPIATVADLAEFLGRSPEEVWQQLDRLRAEQAFAVSTPKKTSQLPLLGVAVVLLGAAYGIYKVTPRKMTDAEIDNQLEQVRAERASRPRKIHYPIAKTVDVTGAIVPGYRAQFDGVLTTTSYLSSTLAAPVTLEEAKRRIKEALRKEYEDARKREAEAPPPTEPLKPRQNNWMPKPGPDQMILQLTVGNSGSQSAIPMNPELAGPQLDQLANGVAEALWSTQERALNPPDDQRYGVTMPPGFSVMVGTGTARYSGSASTLALIPIDPLRVRQRLDLAIRDQIRRSLNPDEPITGHRMFTPGPTLDLTVTGPGGKIEVTLPLKPGGKFKTGADALREYERGIAEVLDKAEKQVREVNAGKG